ncbi:MAG: ammonium transporter [Hydrogenothermaceae bacterium]|nr:ammonium transporter [Hydrogenothermaceae bacterium]
MKKLGITLGFLLPAISFAEETKSIDPGNTAWMIVATAFVMLMTPAGLALFYGGMTRSKNILNTMGMSLVAYCIASLVWIMWGFTLTFGRDIGGVIGGLDYIFFSNISVSDVWSVGNIPTLLFATFQMTFAGITLALTSGSIIERMKLQTWVVISVLWVSLVYAPIAHWVWGGGFLASDGALDFAGGTVVHINAGIAGLVLALLLGKRKDYGKKVILPSSVVLTVFGAVLLWFGWFGFNAGSELAADGIAANAFLVTNAAASVGALSWMVVEWVFAKRPTLLGMASGIVSGLVAITPAAGFVDVSGALIIGLVSGVIGFVGVFWLKKLFKYDDSLDAFGVHALNGIWGALATGIFANPAVNELGKGLLYGNPTQLLIQLKAVAVTIIFTAVMTAVIYFVASILTGGARVDEESETKGLDESIHGERGFEL